MRVSHTACDTADFDHRFLSLVIQRWFWAPDPPERRAEKLLAPILTFPPMYGQPCAWGRRRPKACLPITDNPPAQTRVAICATPYKKRASSSFAVATKKSTFICFVFTPNPTYTGGTTRRAGRVPRQTSKRRCSCFTSCSWRSLGGTRVGWRQSCRTSRST